jgi:hypothetical protein
MTIYRISIVEYVMIDMIISTDEISIVAGWAPGHEGVKISPPFLLHPEAATSHLTRRKKNVGNKIVEGKIEIVKEKGEDSIVKGDKLSRRRPHPLEKQNGERDLMRVEMERREKANLLNVEDERNRGEEEAERMENDRRRDPLRQFIGQRDIKNKNEGSPGRFLLLESLSPPLTTIHNHFKIITWQYFCGCKFTSSFYLY